ncbi:hypothetical protein GJ744_008180 [Endocarpon pusillum]|uniref:Peptidase metallopeptidase domain-containing protein n=1 Tax=Endocarpon pusillum TaxID=364733 RepID=A0A8H7ALP5_9EURO|nr:hypothetical protein GJ744_008180 [Endocarpon pusillum]
MSKAKKDMCLTQNQLMPTVGKPPSSTPSSETGVGACLNIGMGSIIPRWDIVRIRNRKLLYFIRKDSFPDRYTAQRAEAAFRAAAQEWNNVGFGLRFEAVSNLLDAHFHLVYSTASTLYAKAFFPNSVRDVEVYPNAFDPKRAKDGLKKTFMHELGHILGLRHEFAIKNKELGNPVQFMKPNEFSIMAYGEQRDLQESDKYGVTAFYRLPNGYKYMGRPITDFAPVAKRFIKR